MDPDDVTKEFPIEVEVPEEDDFRLDSDDAESLLAWREALGVVLGIQK